MVKHILTTEDADQINLATSFSRDRGDDPEKNPGAVEGDEYDALDLPNGNRLILLGAVNGNVQGVEVPAPDSEDETYPENPDESPVTEPGRSDWDSLTDAQRAEFLNRGAVEHDYQPQESQVRPPVVQSPDTPVTPPTA